MNAAQLVAALLDGEDPKEFFRSAMPRSRLPRIKDVTFELEAEWEQDDPSGHFDDREDVEFVRQQIRDGNVWGWCSTHVIAKWTAPDGQEVQGDDYLGGCSYLSREDFMAPGGYYDDMKSEAYDRLCAKLERMGYR